MTPRRLVPILILVLAGLGPAGCGRAQNANLPEAVRAPPRDAVTMKMSFAPVVKKAAPAVVNVYSRRVVRQMVDPFWGMFMGGGVPQNRVEQSLGSGSIVRADGVVLTNHHVIENAQEIMVVTADRREWPAKVLLDDARADLAVLKIDTRGESLPTIAIDDRQDVQVGDLVLAIGDPFGVGQTVTNGIVSAKARSDVGIADFSSFIQTDAAINPGNSGGPLVDMDGNLVGVNTAILSRSGTSSGVGFAIPAVMARQVVETALGGGHAVVRPWIGARAQSLTGEMARSLGLPSPQGVLVADLWPGGPAARAGIQQGDVIVSVDGQPVNDEGGLNYRVGTRHAGDSLTFAVRRGAAEPRNLAVRVEAPPDSPAADQRTIEGRNPLGGATVVNFSPAKASELGLDPFAGQGVVIVKIDQGFGQQLGLQPGDFVREVNGQKVASTADLARIIAAGGHAWTVTIQRNGQLITAQVRA
ncbi:Do family serine endopeptidase [Caulobacter sp. KR2-114]|uniref:Do family serine endopeptidase n=1 Tax=Caulobacter sp. KR2-114 TaxID=3400912 RepID=UPI003C08C5BD